METIALQHETVFDNACEADVMLGAAMRVAEQFGFDPAGVNQDLQNMLTAEPTALEAPLVAARCGTFSDGQGGRVHAYGE